MSFYPIQVEYKDKLKTVKEAPLVYDVERLKSDLLTTMPAIFTFGVSNEKLEAFYKRLQSKSEQSFHEISERAKDHVTHHTVTSAHIRTLPDYGEPKHTRSKTMNQSNFITALPMNEEEEEEKPQKPVIVHKVLVPKVLPPLDIEKTIREAQGFTHMNKEIEELQKNISKAKKGLRRYGAEIIKTKEQIDNLNFHAQDNFGVSANPEIRARADYLFDAMGEDEEVKKYLRPATKDVIIKKRRHASVGVRPKNTQSAIELPKQKPSWGSPRPKNEIKRHIPKHLMNMPRSRLSELQEPIRGFVGQSGIHIGKKNGFIVSMFT